jgi:hypothetical protein
MLPHQPCFVPEAWHAVDPNRDAVYTRRDHVVDQSCNSSCLLCCEQATASDCQDEQHDTAHNIVQCTCDLGSRLQLVPIDALHHASR